MFVPPPSSSHLPSCSWDTAPLFDRAQAAVSAANGADDASVASIEANQASVLSAAGKDAAADELFAMAAARIRQSVVALESPPQPAGGGADGEEESTLFMVQVCAAPFVCPGSTNPPPTALRPTTPRGQVMHARVLKLYGAHEAKHGRDEHALTLHAEATRLEMTYGFAS